jgi:predicted RNase H-like HicB family nuclease
MGIATASNVGTTSSEQVDARIQLGGSVDLPIQKITHRTCSALVVHTGDTWTALCPDLEVAADGDTAEDAFQGLLRAIEAVLEYDSIDSRPQTPPNEVLALTDSHHGPEPMRVFVFHLIIEADDDTPRIVA